MHILITGGAGFIGSHLADDLIGAGHVVRVLDILDPQVHGPLAHRPEHLHRAAELQRGDVRDPAAVARALDGIDAVFHFAAAVGVGQSMYQVEHYTSTNAGGTAVLLQALVRQPVTRLIVASSMSLYGEGMYRRPDGVDVEHEERSRDQLRSGVWDLCSEGMPLVPVPTPERKRPCLSSVYALSKYDQERLCLLIGNAYNIPTVALRFFNVFGPRQALSNPYTGVLAIFASRLLNRRPPLIFEDGQQRRDFVSVHDVVQACRLALEVPDAAGRAFNVGSGRAYTIAEVAAMMASALDQPISPVFTGEYRVGDIRHCFADISLARSVLGYEPAMTLERGIDELARWLRDQSAEDHVATAHRELATRGLTV
jgi:dTDP-L-rhamnose 4-epimerase